MSVVTLQELKDYLPVIHDADDAKLQLLIDGAEDEAVQFLDRGELPKIGQACPNDCDTSILDEFVSDGADLPPSIRMAIYLLVQSRYDAVSIDDMIKLRTAAETLLFPFRCRLGI